MTNPDIAARHAEIVGKPPRTVAVERDAIIEEVRAATSRLRADLFGDPNPLPDAHIPAIMFTMQPYGRIWERIMAMSMQLLGPDCTLPRREQKLVILRIGWLLQAPFEWGEHVKQAHAMGIGPDLVERIAAEGSAAAGWTPLEAAVLKATEELHGTAMIGEETWEALSAQLSPQQIFELIVLVGQFTTVAYFQNAMRIALEHGSEGLFAR